MSTTDLECKIEDFTELTAKQSLFEKTGMSGYSEDKVTRPGRSLRPLSGLCQAST